MNDLIKHSEYRDWLRDLKQQIKTGQIKAALSVNSHLIMLYWDMGRQGKAVTNFNLTFLHSGRNASLGRKNTPTQPFIPSGMKPNSKQLIIN